MISAVFGARVKPHHIACLKGGDGVEERNGAADMSARQAAAMPAECELLITRSFDAPVSLVFQAWACAEHQMHWMGPTGFTVLTCELDFRPGGRHRTSILSPDGIEYCFHGVYREIVENERLVFTFAWEEEGERGMENVVTLQFSEHEGRTHMHFRQAPFRSQAERDGHHGGWSGCFERLAAFVGREQA